MVALEVCGQLSVEQPLEAGYPLFAAIEDNAFAQSLDFTVSAKARGTLVVKQRSFLDSLHYCISEHAIYTGSNQQLILPKLKGLAQLELRSTVPLTINYASFLKTAANTSSTYAVLPSDVVIAQHGQATSWIRFEDSLRLMWQKPAEFILAGTAPIKGNEAYLTKLDTKFVPLAIQFPHYKFELLGVVECLQQTNYYHCTIANSTLSNVEANIAIFRLNSEVKQSNVFTSQQVIHVQL